MIRAETQTIDLCVSLQDPKAYKFASKVAKYCIKTISSLNEKVGSIIHLVSDQILDHANDYDSLVYVLTIIGDFYQTVAQSIFKLYQFAPSFEHKGVFQAEYIKAKEQCQHYYKLALKTSTVNLKNEEPIKIRLVNKLCTFFYSIMDNRKYALEMARNFDDFIHTENSAEALELRDQIKLWTIEINIEQLDNSYITVLTSDEE
jgi:hypothetical protein